MTEASTDLVLFLGRFHPVLVHLPIGFLVLLAALELLALAPLVVLTVWIGVAPRPFLAVIESALPALLSRGWH